MGVLSGYRIVEFAGIGPAPMAAMLLSDMGAEVLRIDRVEESHLGIRMEHRYNLLCRGRRSVAIDLKHREGREAALKLIARSHALIEGFRPGVMERFGAGTRSLPGPQSPAGLRAGDRMGAGGSPGADRRPRHRLHCLDRGSARNRRRGWTARSASQPGGGFRRRRGLPGPGPGGRDAGGQDVGQRAGNRRGHGRRRGLPDDLRLRPAGGRAVDRWPSRKHPGRRRPPTTGLTKPWTGSTSPSARWSPSSGPGC